MHLYYLKSGVTQEEILDRTKYYHRYTANISYKKNGVFSSSNYTDEDINKITVRRSLYSGNKPSIGNANAAEMEIEFTNYDLTEEMLFYEDSKENQVIIYLYCNFYEIESNSRVAGLSEEVFFSDKIEISSEEGKVVFHAYDALGNANKQFVEDQNMIYMLHEPYNILENIAYQLGIQLNENSNVSASDFDYLTPSYMKLSFTDTMYELLCILATLLFGNFVIQNGTLKLIKIFDLPAETFYLIDEYGNCIMFGDDRILTRA